ncbi:phage head-tail connector protein [Lapidilactobacillus bayanensis]|uniref:phage head-tail connector protein n=1 Tax=Lapidilactobacillus bayanensis TaxID=2485998 RepID=UPI000F7A162F|nr:phage head-tail connector protein [Lapidilactobacillus bayanensis]
MAASLEQIKTLLGIDNTDQDTSLNTVISLIESRLASKIGKDYVPDELQYIVVEASISRFNRINDEGKTSATENEVSATWQTDDLAPFASDIEDWISKNNAENAHRVRFL